MSEEPAGEATESADGSLEGRRFHRHARNCNICRAQVSAEESDPTALCDDGQVFYVKAVQATDAYKERIKADGNP